MARRLPYWLAPFVITGLLATRLVAADELGVSLWYRGTPPGQPRQEDLATIRALGFASVTWPSRSAAGVGDLRRMAGEVGISVQVRSQAQLLSAASALHPRPVMDLAITEISIEEIPALVWRAVAHGARVICFDPGSSEGTGLQNSSGRTLPWIGAAKSIARQLNFNAKLFNSLRPAPAVKVLGPAAPALDVALLQDDRSWVLFATNATRARVRAVARLPSTVPAAMWVNLLDGSQMSMLSEPIGPRWNLDLEAGAARIYVIDKSPK
jgi:hypothetical protein